jgi:hypothetical protein
MMLITTKMSSEKYINSTYSLSEIQKNEKYIRIARKLHEASMKVELEFLIELEPLFNRFLKFFQKKEPLIHLLQIYSPDYSNLIWCKSMLNMMLITTKMSSEKYINSTYSLSESILRLDLINSNRIARKLNDASMKVELEFLIELEPLFNRFLKLFQKEESLFHLLHEEMAIFETFCLKKPSHERLNQFNHFLV